MTPVTYPKLQLFVGGEWIDGNGDCRGDVVNPATEELIAQVPYATEEELGRALSAAAVGFLRWRERLAADRKGVLSRTAAILMRRRDELAAVMTTEQGKPLAEASGEVDRAIETFEWFAEQAGRVHGTVYCERISGVHNMVLPEPVGVVAAFTPWNFPAFLPARKIAPALAAGCAVVLKAAEETPATAIIIMQALEEAGVPAGVVNLVYGVPSDVSRYLLASPVVKKVSFTGSVAVGKQLARLASQNLQRCTLELGGHSPAIVFSDAKLADVVKTAGAFKFRNAGQVCIAPNRFYVHTSVYKRFVEGLADVARNMNVGPGGSEGVTMGPLANRRRLEAMSRFVDDASSRGARLVTGGRRVGNRGFFFEPTVLGDVPDEALVMRQEPFGPIAPVTPFNEDEEVIQRANALGYGLAAYVFTGSAKRATRMSSALEAGTVGVNHMSPAHADIPMGGVKESGYGYEGGHEGLDAYLVKKHLARAEI